MISIDEQASIVLNQMKIAGLAEEVSISLDSSRIGNLMDFHSLNIAYQGREIGKLHIVKAVTFLSVVYIGENPLNPNEKIRKESYRVLYGEEADFSRLKRYVESKAANRQLPDNNKS